jgi:hypothetical protein
VSKEDYYKKYVILDVDFVSSCKNCGKPTRFISLVDGYARCCGIRCGKLFDCRNPAYREKISLGTIKAMRDPKIIKLLKMPKSDAHKKKLSAMAKRRFIDNPDLRNKMYTKERNEKISKSKKKYWNSHPEERRRIMDVWKKRSETKLEIKMYKFLEDNNISFEKRYELESKQYDAFLPDHNILLEFDGEFWHQLSLDECKYSFQTFNFYNDRRKDEIAKNHNIPLFRIREFESPEKILEIIKERK